MSDIQFRDHHAFEKLIEPLPAGARVLVAARLALRAFPAIGADAPLADIVPVMRCLLLAHAAACGVLGRDTALDDGVRAAADDAIEASFNDGVNSWAASAAGKAATALAAKFAGRRAAGLRHAASALIGAENALRELAGVKQDAAAQALHDAASHDVQGLVRNADVLEVARLPLWLAAPPDAAARAWGVLRTRLGAGAQHRVDWARWFDERLAGAPIEPATERVLAETWRDLPPS